MLTIILFVHVLVAVTLIGLILIQRGKGADIGAAFGSGASQTVFGSQGSASFLTRTTAVLATVFFLTSLSLAYLYSHRVERVGVTDFVEQPVTVLSEEPVGTQKAGDKDIPLDVPIVPEGTPDSDTNQQ